MMIGPELTAVGRHGEHIHGARKLAEGSAGDYDGWVPIEDAALVHIGRQWRIGEVDPVDRSEFDRVAVGKLIRAKGRVWHPRMHTPSARSVTCGVSPHGGIRCKRGPTRRQCRRSPGRGASVAAASTLARLAHGLERA